LSTIIREYTQTAEPVGSKLLENRGNLGVSSATIRADMHDLEDLGYLTHPHTSSGRVPTHKAFRYFVDNIIQNTPRIDINEAELIQEELEKNFNNPSDINKALAKVLSGLSGNMIMTGIIGKNEFHKTGISALMSLPEFREIDRIFNITSFFDEFDEIFEKMAGEIFGSENIIPTIRVGTGDIGKDIKILIGKENPLEEMSGETVIISRYLLPQNYIGSLTLVGPMRMDYERNLGLVKFATKYLNLTANRPLLLE